MTKHSKTARKPRLDADLVRDAAAGRWLEILMSVGGIPRESLDGRHHPCPRCGGTDRFRLVDRDAGAVLCNQCFNSRNGDGFAAISWLRGTDFPATVREVAGYLGVDATGDNGSPAPAKHKTKPDEHLDFQPWKEFLVSLWCRHKPPITPAGVLAAGGRRAMYRDQYCVIAIPVWGPLLDAAEPVGWAIWNSTGRGLPKTGPDGQVEWITKPKLTYGSSAGLIGDFERLRNAEVVWKLEGVSDVLSWLSLPDLPSDHAVVTNAMGCQERPAKWMSAAIGECLRGKRTVFVLHDADIPGQRGATGWDDHGKRRPGWAEEISAVAKECRNVTLPYSVAETHGHDFRDWVFEGGTWRPFTALRSLADAGQVVTASEDQANEAVDDPYRLARINLDRYALKTGGRTLRCWQESWWSWVGTRYVSLGEGELKAKLTAAIKEEFDRLNRIELEDYRARKESGQLEDDELPPFVRKVQPAIVSAVLNATRAITCLSGKIVHGTWVPDRSRRNYLSMENGLLDIDAVLANKDEVLLPHSPDWFSEVHLPYAFDPTAKCPKWHAFLEKNLEMDPERIKLLQEWAGYLLVPDTGEQRFMIFEGEGANGKSVACAAIEAVLGSDNCSFVQFEVFGDRFSKTQTLGKLVNICGDAGEIDQMAEGVIKAFVSGNPLLFDRKGVPGINCSPTARMMIACNNLPRFRDRSEGIWRRVLLVPWQIQIQPHERIRNMDKASWWRATGELPGILNWALAGLRRLREQKHFSDSGLMQESLAEYRMESNPAKQFFQDFMMEVNSSDSLDKGWLKSAFVYQVYAKWARDNGYHPLSERPFGKEVRRAFSKVQRAHRGTRKSRVYCYVGIDFQEDAVPAENLYSAYVTVNSEENDDDKKREF